MWNKEKLESEKPILDTTLHSYGITNRQELDLLTDNVHDHVYIKITNNNIHNQNTVVDSFSNCWIQVWTKCILRHFLMIIILFYDMLKYYVLKLFGKVKMLKAPAGFKPMTYTHICSVRSIPQRYAEYYL